MESRASLARPHVNVVTTVHWLITLRFLWEWLGAKQSRNERLNSACSWARKGSRIPTQGRCSRGRDFQSKEWNPHSQIHMTGIPDFTEKKNCAPSSVFFFLLRHRFLKRNNSRVWMPLEFSSFISHFVIFHRWVIAEARRTKVVRGNGSATRDKWPGSMLQAGDHL